MPKRHRIKGTIILKSTGERATRFRFKKGIVRRKGKDYRKRFGFRRNRAVEIALVPV